MLLSLSYGAREYGSRIKNDFMLTYFFTGLDFHGCICGLR
jgi:hypothetical protein